MDNRRIGGICCLCGEEYFGYGVNAQPIEEGLCCEICSIEKVMPARLDNLKEDGE